MLIVELCIESLLVLLMWNFDICSYDCCIHLVIKPGGDTTHQTIPPKSPQQHAFHIKMGDQSTAENHFSTCGALTPIQFNLRKINRYSTCVAFIPIKFNSMEENYVFRSTQWKLKFSSKLNTWALPQDDKQEMYNFRFITAQHWLKPWILGETNQHLIVPGYVVTMCFANCGWHA